MPRPADGAPAIGAFAPALRAVRRRRGLKVGEIARRMGLARRTYEYFEARSRLQWEKLKRFAAATESDPCAILISVAMGSPDFAARCVDSRLASQIVQHLRILDASLGDDLAGLDQAGVARGLEAFTEAMTAEVRSARSAKP